MQRYYTVKQVARKLCVHERTIWRWILSGQLGSVMFGARGRRISDEHIEAFARPVKSLELERAA